MDRRVSNSNYDEAIDVPDPEDIATPRIPSSLSHSTNHSARANFLSNNKKIMEEESDQGTPRDDSFGRQRPASRPSVIKRSQPQPPNTKALSHGDSSGEGDEDDDEDEDDDDDDIDSPLKAPEGAYNPADYEHLVVSQDIKELFQYIHRYTPQAIELETYLRPFIPDYIPCVGDIDAFLKVPPPNGKPDGLGLLVLDEPCANQSDPTVLDLHLRAISKQSTSKQTVVKTVENGDKMGKSIDQWIKSISDLHRSKPPPTVHYSKNMPDIESLMQEWPPEFEELLKSVSLPTSELNCDLGTYVDVICNLLDIPVYQNRIQSLHVLFTLFSEFRNSQHFQ